MTTLYLKYRPQTLDDLDLVDVRNTLKNMVKSESIPHALLFCGPRGSGKTSAARILAKIVNCESGDRKKRGTNLVNPCNDCEQCKSITNGTNIDVIELDAASHRGIDDVRTLRDAVKLSPARANKKVYIIDEAHMLTTEASNALLKTLEEPPEHVIFILATTNPEKLIETIRSRTAIVNFTKAKQDEVVGSLQQVVKNEKLKVPDSVLETIAKSSDGSFRDAKKILEQLINEGIVTDEKKVKEHLTKNILFNLDEFFQNLSNKDTKNALDRIEKAVEGGMPVSALTEKIMVRLHDAILFECGLDGEKLTGFDKNQVIELVSLISEKLSFQPYAVIEQLPIELAIAEWGAASDVNENSDEGGTGSSKNHNEEDIKQNVSKFSSNFEKSKTSSVSVEISSSFSQDPPNKNKEDLPEENKILDKLPSNGGDFDPGEVDGNEFGEDLWSKVLNLVRPRNPSTEALLRAAKPMKLSDEYLFLGVYYSFHKEKLESIQHRSLLEETLENVIGKKLKIQCFLTDPPQRKNADNFKAPDYVSKTVPSRSNGINSDPNSGYNFKETGDSEEKSSDVLLTEPDDDDIIKLAEDIFGK